MSAPRAACVLSSSTLSSQPLMMQVSRLELSAAYLIRASMGASRFRGPSWVFRSQSRTWQYRRSSDTAVSSLAMSNLWFTYDTSKYRNSAPFSSLSTKCRAVSERSILNLPCCAKMLKAPVTSCFSFFAGSLLRSRMPLAYFSRQCKDDHKNCGIRRAR